MTEYFHYKGSACNVNYHFVWVTKYRRQVLTFPEEVKKMIQDICAKQGWAIKALEVMPDHVHIFITTPPVFAPSQIVKNLKGITGRQIFLSRPELKAQLRAGHLWSPSYYCGTVGTVSAETVRLYIEMQKQGGTSSPD